MGEDARAPAVLIATLGTSDVQFRRQGGSWRDGENIEGERFRERTRALLENLESRRDQLTFPLLLRAFQKVEERGHGVVNLVLIATDQESKHPKDTIDAAEIVKGCLGRSDAPVRVPDGRKGIFIKTYKGNPVDIGATVEFAWRTLRQIRAELDRSELGSAPVFLELTGGTQELSMAFGICGFDAFGDSREVHVIQVEKETGSVSLSPIGGLLRWRDHEERQLALLEVGAYGAALRAHEEMAERHGGLWPRDPGKGLLVKALLAHADARQCSDIARARRALRDALDKPGCSGKERLRQLVASMPPDEDVEDPRALHVLLADAIEACEEAASHGRYHDLVQRIYQIKEVATRAIAIRSGIALEPAKERQTLKQFFEANPRLVERGIEERLKERIAPDLKMEAFVSPRALVVAIELAGGAPAEAADALLVLRQLDPLVQDVRNRKATHGIGSVSRKDVESALETALEAGGEPLATIERIGPALWTLFEAATGEESKVKRLREIGLELENIYRESPQGF